MEQITDLRHVKALLVETLNTFARFCDEHELRYYLMGGTLLGAVRHGGFIPWDDDIDVGMPRPDYMRFIEMTRDGLGDHYVVRSPYDGTHYTFPFAKICDARTYAVGKRKTVEEDLGVAFDIFPIDGLPSGQKDIERYFTRQKILRRFSDYARFALTWEDAGRHFCLWRRGLHHLPFWLIQLIIGKILGYRFWIKRIDDAARRFDFTTSESIGVSVWGYGSREATDRKNFEPRIELSFENGRYFGSAGYDAYLRSLYGDDYMQLPPEEKRISAHEFVFYWREAR